MFFFLQEHVTANPSLWDTIVQSNILNVLIAVAFLAWLINKVNVPALLESKQSQIVKELNDAEERRAKALQEVEELEKRSAKLADEVESLLKDAQQTAHLVSQSILNNAEEEAQKILSNAQKRIVLEQKTASRELEQRLMREAIHGSRQLLENTLNDKDKHRSVEDFVASLPALYEKEAQR